MSKEKFDIQDLGTVKLPEEQHKLAITKIAEADKEVEQMRMQIRWGLKQVALVKRAAKLIGVPYQTYIKQVLFHQALRDIEKSNKTLQ